MRAEWKNLNGRWNFRRDDQNIGMKQRWFDATDFEVEIPAPFALESSRPYLLQPKTRTKSNPVWPKKPTAKNIRGERPWMLGTDSAKPTIMGRLRNAQPGAPGYSHFPADRDQSYLEHSSARCW